VGWIVAAVAGCVAAAQEQTSSPGGQGQANTGATVPVRGLGRLPLYFEANQGQANQNVRYLAHGPSYSLLLTDAGATIVLAGRQHMQPGQAVTDTTPSTSLHFGLVGANPTPQLTALEPLPGKSNYLLGNDPSKWQIGVTQYQRVEYKAAYPGVDLAYYGQGGKLEYDFILAAGADPGQIRLKIEGATQIEVAGGDLLLHTSQGVLRQLAPRIYQDGPEGRREVAGGYQIVGQQEIGFALTAYDPQRSLVIDPVIDYATYLGGSSWDDVTALAVDAASNTYVSGWSMGSDFPTTPGSFQPYAPVLANPNEDNYNAFVAKLNPSGSGLLYATYLGGAGFDVAEDIKLAADGSVVVVGSTGSTDFPLEHPLAGHAYLSGLSDNFVARLSPDGSSIVYGTYLGGSGVEGNQYGVWPYTHLALDSSGAAYVASRTTSTDILTTSGVVGQQPTTIYLTKINFSGGNLGIAYASYLGGSGYQLVAGITLDGAGNIYLAGTTDGTLPTVNAFQPNSAGYTDGYIAVLNPNATAYRALSYLGGSYDDAISGIGLDSAGNIYVAGYTGSADFPTLNPIYGYNASYDAFLTKISLSSQLQLSYSTYLGGGGWEQYVALAVSSDGTAYLNGYTGSTDFPLLNPTQVDCPPPDPFVMCSTGFVSKIIQVGGLPQLAFSTYLGNRDFYCFGFVPLLHLIVRTISTSPPY